VADGRELGPAVEATILQPGESPPAGVMFDPPRDVSHLLAGSTSETTEDAVAVKRADTKAASADRLQYAQDEPGTVAQSEVARALAAREAAAQPPPLVEVLTPNAEPDPPVELRGVFRRKEQRDRVYLSDYGYDGLWVELWLNPPQKLTKSWTTGTPVTQILPQIIKGWNYCDEKGRQLGYETEEDLEEVDMVLLGIINMVFWNRYNNPLAVATKRLSERGSEA
jgi:hypothetical protein